MTRSFAVLFLFVASAFATAQQVAQIPDGQLQAKPGVAAAPVKQIADGQIQAPKSAAPAPAPSPVAPAPVAPVKQIADGQIQAPVSAPAAASTGKPVSAPLNATSVAFFTGGAAHVGLEKGVILASAGMIAGLALL